MDGPVVTSLPAPHATVLREVATMAERLPIPDRYRHHSALADAWDDGRDAAVESGRLDVGTEFVRQADQPDEVGLTAFEADLDEAQKPPAPLTPCTCRQAVHAREHTNRPIPGCPWCTTDDTTTGQEP